MAQQDDPRQQHNEILMGWVEAYQQEKQNIAV
jgi:hypothetical protein